MSLSNTEDSSRNTCLCCIVSHYQASGVLRHHSVSLTWHELHCSKLSPSIVHSTRHRTAEIKKNKKNGLTAQQLMETVGHDFSIASTNQCSTSERLKPFLPGTNKEDNLESIVLYTKSCPFKNEELKRYEMTICYKCVATNLKMS